MSGIDAWPLLAAAASPRRLRAIPARDIPELCSQIRDFLIEHVCATGGHLGVNLGVVELSVALHRVFDSPREPIVFDVGHQSYVHKILTGRAEQFTSLRQREGLSGYPNRGESEHDWVENSHASTALSYADGLANAYRRDPDSRGRTVVAVIGDGALTGGLAWEGCNNLAARPDRPIVVVLNDNGRSYDSTVGGIARHLTLLRRGEDNGSLFEQLGLDYLGPVDGHDVAAVEHALRCARDRARTVVVHVITEKGRGYEPAENDAADRMHAIGVLDRHTGRPVTAAGTSWTSIFGAELLALAAARPDIVCVTAAMLQPVGLREFARLYPDRIFDVGIAEQHAACSAAGLAMGGLHPIVAIYSTFFSRAFDQVLMDVALHQLPVTFVLDRAGITGPDGPSHHGMWDTGLLSLVPGLRTAAPRDPTRLRELLREAVAQPGPTALRIPKATAGKDIPALSRMDGLDILHRSSGQLLQVLLICAGVVASQCLQAATQLEEQGYGVTVIDPRWVDPIPAALTHMAARHDLAVTVEDGSISGGIGTNLLQAAARAGITTPIRSRGLERRFLLPGGRTELLAESGISAPGICDLVTRTLPPARTCEPIRSPR
ncbi:1-deoxy-D-xylulose-5-phosphate synthase [Nocardia brasiliensis NBRC 14402]|uniref:1-deoxy-D-xylulose-5-phosphate synthase n=1 Tax=Nocardia brasiliensis TaxID=37326 RepID=UPI0002DB66A6|nr:1-deoxy-D-xylulose-5-phosphate synthase [Nocardia brasiliensis]ASF12199.1 1-deoxy-D-xylulose-5-phosphate synthase [Nocardia brasiliensis]GAJ85888.1 1-deoxy-D-xylulose-5-phosphate synthase [Nocardia brasiliensis NBRC 14402]SUB53120.1 1-deoxy-D-xylulose-5-phosphate synthase [Nocardia brasiliensis]